MALGGAVVPRSLRGRRRRRRRANMQTTRSAEGMRLALHVVSFSSLARVGRPRTLLVGDAALGAKMRTRNAVLKEAANQCRCTSPPTYIQEDDQPPAYLPTPNPVRHSVPRETSICTPAILQPVPRVGRVCMQLSLSHGPDCPGRQNPEIAPETTTPCKWMMMCAARPQQILCPSPVWSFQVISHNIW